MGKLFYFYAIFYIYLNLMMVSFESIPRGDYFSLPLESQIVRAGGTLGGRVNWYGQFVVRLSVTTLHI